jgi:hypothetical protein
MQDMPVNMTNMRRRSNSSTAAHSAATFKSKFELVEAEPVFEDMPMEDDHLDLEHRSTTSTDNVSIEEDAH